MVKARTRILLLSLVLALGTLSLVASAATVHSDGGREYSVPATYRWQQEWKDKRHRTRTAWQEGEVAHYRGNRAISVCVTYYKAPYYACQGNFVDWYWGSVGRRSGYVTVVDPKCPGCRHYVWGLFRRLSGTQKTAPSAGNGSLASWLRSLQTHGMFGKRMAENWIPPVSTPFGESSSRRLSSERQIGADIGSHPWSDDRRVVSVFLFSGRTADCLVVILGHGLGTVLGCTPRSLAAKEGVVLVLQGKGTSTVVGALPKATTHATFRLAGGRRSPVPPEAFHGFIRTFGGRVVSLFETTGHRSNEVALG